MRERVDIQQPDSTKSGGQPAPDWTPSVMQDVPCEITAVASDEVRRIDQRRQVDTFEVKLLFYERLAGIGAKWRLINDKHGTLNVTSVRRVWEGGVEYHYLMAKK